MHDWSKANDEFLPLNVGFEFVESELDFGWCAAFAGRAAAVGEELDGVCSPQR